MSKMLAIRAFHAPNLIVFQHKQHANTQKPCRFFFAPYRFTGLRDCPTQCARLLHPANTRVLPVPRIKQRLVAGIANANFYAVGASKLVMHPSSSAQILSVSPPCQHIGTGCWASRKPLMLLRHERQSQQRCIEHLRLWTCCSYKHHKGVT